ncbi:MAG: tetratricopeptide repeat protein, partial [Desulfobacteraceae bacterium]
MEPNMIRISHLSFLFALLLTVAVLGCAKEEDQETAHFEKAQKFMTEKNYKEAVLELKNVIQINPENDAARLVLGDAYMKLGEFPMAVESYNAAVKNNPDNMDAYIKMGQVLLVAESTLNARKAAKIILEKRPGDIDGMLLLAGVQVQEKNL